MMKRSSSLGCVGKELAFFFSSQFPRKKDTGLLIFPKSSWWSCFFLSDRGGVELFRLSFATKLGFFFVSSSPCSFPFPMKSVQQPQTKTDFLGLFRLSDFPYFLTIFLPKEQLTDIFLFLSPQSLLSST